MSVKNETVRLLRLPDVRSRTGLGKSAIYAKVAANAFPQPVAVSERAVAWYEHEIEAWILALPRGVGPRRGAAA